MTNCIDLNNYRRRRRKLEEKETVLGRVRSGSMENGSLLIRLA